MAHPSNLDYLQGIKNMRVDPEFVLDEVREELSLLFLVKIDDGDSTYQLRLSGFNERLVGRGHREFESVPFVIKSLKKAWHRRPGPEGYVALGS
jgi:hypothetical protein